MSEVGQLVHVFNSTSTVNPFVHVQTSLIGYLRQADHLVWTWCQRHCGLVSPCPCISVGEVRRVYHRHMYPQYLQPNSYRANDARTGA